MTATPHFKPSTAHASLGDALFDLVEPAVFPKHILRYRNQVQAARVGLDTLTDAEWVDHFSRFKPLQGSFPRPLALRYHGHQFQNYNPELGDGRGFLFGQAHDLVDGRLLDFGTKGSGRTPWSRGGDGKLTLKGGVREVLATSMLEALGVYTSKSFSLIETGEALTRGDEPSPTRSAVLVRLNHSHIRIGTFQRLAYHQDTDSIRRLLDYTIRTYMPELWREAEADRVLAFLEAVTAKVARLGAEWMLAGFVHGVLNTDNINVTGESFDYGPWRFLPTYQPEFTAAYFDTGKLYAYGRQPDTLLWNLIRLAECLLPLSDQATLEAVLRGFGALFYTELSAAMLRRLGLRSQGPDIDTALVQQVWQFLRESQMPFEQFFFDWYGGSLSADRATSGPSAGIYAEAGFASLRMMIDGFEPAAGLRLDHPYFAGHGPCTMLIDEVEAIWAPIAADDDWSLFRQKLVAIDQMAEAYGMQTSNHRDS
ncbi:YdiU family protein [Lichenicola cladoniae]|uniref:Protein nucleotidyltransferase YdiU n=1 Tax=Lichenicola cladoniae TaxID=1484109 RepID=A0A6M8HUV4_9PROT|nr:YdiU family protein [Lichenicola cladoniae]NPD66690.1 YdiU family protein [Acetobacteraceae bacterium]QKE92313.1 YdiU family protein [Lichenicola cladoniae]